MINTSIISSKEFIIVDIETTGFSAEQCTILEISALKIYNGEIKNTYHTFIKQTLPIPSFITSLTKITDKDVLDGIEIKDAMKQFLTFIEDLPLVGHNISFDYHFLNYNSINRLGVEIENVRIDTIKFAKDLLSDVSNYKLLTLADYFNISSEGHHRAEKDTIMTYELVKHLSHINEDYKSQYKEQIEKSAILGNQFRNKKVVIKTKLKNIKMRYLECVLEDLNCKIWDALYLSANCLIMNDSAYDKFLHKEDFDEFFEGWLIKARVKKADGRLEVYSESQICELLQVPIVEKTKSTSLFPKRVTAKEIVAQTDDFDETHPLYEKNCLFTGALDRYDRKTAMQYVINVGGKCQDGIRKDTDYLILGDNSFSATIKDGKSSKLKKAENMILKGSPIQIIPETTFYQLLKNE